MGNSVMSVWKKMFGAGALLTGCGVLGVAMAEGWSDYLSTFPAQPCPDGWTACVIGEEVLNPGVVLDAAGHPHPSDMRFGFYESAVSFCIVCGLFFVTPGALRSPLDALWKLSGCSLDALWMLSGSRILDLGSTI